MTDPLTSTFRALGNARRRLILETVWKAATSSGPRSAGRPYATITDLARRLRISQPAVSQYVDRLVRAGLVEIKRVGAAHLCIPNDESVRKLLAYFEDLLDTK